MEPHRGVGREVQLILVGAAAADAANSMTSFTASQALADHSRFVQRIRRRYAEDLHRLGPGLPGREAITALVQALRSEGRPLASSLRVTRQLVIERLAVLDVEQAASMADVTLVMTHLAEATLDLALLEARREQDAVNGAPLNEAGEVIEFWVLGMGKLGARELNVSSDIDLIYVYEDDGQTNGAQSISAHEYFTRVAKRLYALIGDVTEDGQVFRVDLALRPNGNSGPPVVSCPCWRSTSSSRAASGSALPGSRAASSRRSTPNPSAAPARWPSW